MTVKIEEASPRILIVEDEVLIASSLASRLKNLGYEVCAKVTSGEKAIELVENEYPDLILMDIIIKGGMDGIETARLIRSSYKIPVVYLTAYADQELIDRAKLTMPFGYLLKPCHDQDLKVTLEMALFLSKMDAERRLTEEALQQSEEQFRDLYENAPNAYFSVNAENGYILQCNETAVKLLGYPKEIMLRMKAIDLYADKPDGVPKAMAIFRRITAGQSIKDAELLMKHQTGRSIWISLFVEPVLTADGRVTESRSMVIDISDRKKSTDTQRENEYNSPDSLALHSENNELQ